MRFSSPLLGPPAVHLVDHAVRLRRLGVRDVVEATTILVAEGAVEAGAVPVADDGVGLVDGAGALEADLERELVPGALAGDPDGEGPVLLGPAEQHGGPGQGLVAGWHGIR